MGAGFLWTGDWLMTIVGLIRCSKGVYYVLPMRTYGRTCVLYSYVVVAVALSQLWSLASALCLFLKDYFHVFFSECVCYE